MFQDFEDPQDMRSDARRLDRLREALAARGCDGFAVPREDVWQSEYVPPANERLKWLTGFGGSAGVAIVLADRAALFVDGRYVLQAPQQVDTAHFEIVPIAETTPTAWLKTALADGQTFAIDPRLHTRAAVAAWRKAVEAAGAKLVCLEDNPIDTLWPTGNSRPSLPETPVIIHPDAASGTPSAAKREALAAQLVAAEQDAMLITKPENIAWLLNIRAADVPHAPLALSFGILHADAAFDWYIDTARLDEDVRAHLGAAVRPHPPENLAEDLAALTGKIHLDPAATPHWFAEAMQKADIAEGEDLCALPKACKTTAEIAGAIAAHRRDGAALCRFLAWLDAHAPQGGVSEIDAARQAETFRSESGLLRDLSFDTISATGANAAIVHYRVTRATDRPIEAGDLYLIDSGGQYEDGTTDVTRTILIGDAPPPDGAIDAFTRVLQGHIALARARFPEGTTGVQLDALARAPLWAAGLDFDHGTGHGVGSYLCVHEGPQNISKRGGVALRAGMIVSNEPGYYKAGAFGIRIENLQYVIAADEGMLAFAPLTLAPIDTRLVDTALLTPPECDWLNAYHAEVEATIAPLVDADTSAWLKRSCAPI